MSIVDSDYFFPIIGIIFLIGFLLGLFFISSSFQSEMKELREEQKIKNDVISTSFHSLDCSKQKTYLEDKSLRSSTLFDYNIYEELYREYIINCHNLKVEP